MTTKRREELILDFVRQPDGSVKINQATLISASGDGGGAIEGERLGDIFKELVQKHKYLFENNAEFIVSSRWWNTGDERQIDS